MKKSLLDYYKMKYSAGGKVPVRKTGMWYQEGDVVVPSNEITMEGPQEQPDYFKEPILGIGIPSGKIVEMMPGGKYKFKGDKAVYETRKYQTGKPVKNPSSGFSWYANKPTSVVSPSKSQIAAAQGQQRTSTAVARPVSNAAQLKLQQNAQTTKNIKESVKEIYKEIQEEKEAEKAAMQPTTEDIVRQSNIAREKILSGDVTMDNISDWFAAAPEKLKLSSPYSVLTPGLNKKIPESVKPVTDFLDNYVNPISFGGSFWSNAAQAGSDFSKGKGEEGINSALRATLVPAGMLLGQKIAPGLHSVEKSIGQGIQKRVGNIGASAIMNTGPLGSALVTGLGRATVSAGKAGTKAGIQAGEKVGVHTASLPPKEYQKGDIVTNTPISEEIMRRFMVRPEFTNQDFTLPNYVDLAQISSIAKDIKRLGDRKNVTAEMLANPDITSSILDKAKQTQFNLNLNRSGRIGNINLSGQGTAEEIAKGQFNPLSINAGLNLGSLGSIDYSGQVNKGEKLKKAIKPENFVYTNRFGNDELGGDITYVPTKNLKASLTSGEDMAFRYNTRKEDDGRYTDISTSITPGNLSLNLDQSYVDKRLVKQNVKGSIGGEKGRVSVYRNVGEEGKTYGGSFAKTSGDVTYGGNVNYGPEGLQNIGGNLTASDLFNLTYARNREGEGFTNTIGAELMPGQPFSVNFSRAYDNQGMNETTVGGNLNLKNLQAGLSKTFTPEGSSMQGNVNANIGKRVTLGATGDFTNNRLNKLGLKTGVNIVPGFSISAGVEKEIGTGKPKFTFEPKVTKGITKLGNNKKKTFTSIKGQLQQNQPSEENMEVLKKGGRIKYEKEEYEEDDDKEMVEGIADILGMVKDKKNRKQIAEEMVDDFEEEDVDYNLDDFMEAAKLMQMGGMSIPGVNGSVVASSPTNLKMAYMKKGGQHGGLDRWFAEKWVDVKTGKPCGRQEGESRAYPACRPSKRISSKTPKTSSELSSKEKAKFKATKTSSQRIPYNHKRK